MLNSSDRFQKSIEEFEWQILCEKAEHLKSVPIDLICTCPDTLYSYALRLDISATNMY